MKTLPTLQAKDLPKPSPRWGASELESLRRTLEQPSLFYWKNGATTHLIKAFQQHYPLEHVMPVSSGTASIHVAIAAAGVAPGDEVITTPITDMGTVIGILYQQAVPVFADLEPDSYNLSPVDVEAKITPRTKAILIVHLAGNPSDMDAFREIASRHNLILIEDCAQAWGANYKGQPVGTMGDLACYSFNDFKHIGCGDGGIVATSDPQIGAKLQRFADKGYDRSGGMRNPEILGLCYRMSELQAAVAAVQVEERMVAIAETRHRLGDLLCKGLEGIPGIRPHAVRSDNFCSYWFTMFRLEPCAFTVNRNEFVRMLTEEGLQASAGYIAKPLYQFPVFQNAKFFAGRWPLRESGMTTMDYREVSCPEAEDILETAIRLEVKQWMTEDYILLAIEAVRVVAERCHHSPQNQPFESNTNLEKPCK